MSRMKETLGGDLFSAVAPPPPQSLPSEIPESVAALFEKYALEIIAVGRKRYSSDAILHRIRWFHHIERGNADFKCNNNWTAPLARWFIARHPEHGEFFETRASPGGNP